MTSERHAFLCDLMPRLGVVAREGFENPGPVEYKRPGNPVTEIDRGIEDLAREAIGSTFPHDAIQGEERGLTGDAGDPSKTPRWHIDPIDGTMNFVRGIPCFCVSIGVGVGNRMDAGAVLDPLRDELFHAARGKGSFLGEARLSVGEARSLSEAVMCLQAGMHSEFFLRDGMMRDLHRRTSKTRKLGTIALELAYAAAGRVDLVAAGKGRPQAWWDIAGGWALVEGAGGVVCDLSGSAIHEDTSHFAAGPRELVDELVGLFR